MAKDEQSLFDKFFRNSQNQVTISQPPNLPIIVWFVATLLSRLIGGEQAILDYLAFGALFTWVWLEIFQGENLFRRILGVAIMVLLFISKI
jgi:hypothetical protein